MACEGNTNLDVIKYLIEQHKMDTTYRDDNGHTCLIAACWQNTNLDIIKYLIEKHKMDLTHCNKYKKNCLIMACEGNTNLDVIKYLIEQHKMDTTYRDVNEHTCLMAACWKNKNFDIVKYLIEEHKMDLMHCNKYKHNCLTLACKGNKNLDVIEYIIKNTYLIMSLHEIEFEDFKKYILFHAHDYLKFNNYIEQGIKKYDVKLLIECAVLNINPLMIDQTKCNEIISVDPFSEPFNKFVTNVDLLQCTIPYNHKKTHCMIENIKTVRYNKKPEILFTHNNMIYYGDRNIVYDSITMLKDLNENYVFDDAIVLTAVLAEYVVNQYIASCYENRFNMDNILPEDFVDFLNFIDKYPTDILLINLLEHRIIQYIDKYNISKNDNINKLTMRYQLKHLYLYTHQKYT
jgi:hypothetical protein